MTVQVLTVEEAADRLKVHPETVRRWIRAGHLAASKLVSDQAGYRIAESEVTRLLCQTVTEEVPT